MLTTSATLVLITGILLPHDHTLLAVSTISRQAMHMELDLTSVVITIIHPGASRPHVFNQNMQHRIFENPREKFDLPNISQHAESCTRL